MSDNTNKVVVQFIGESTQLERTMKKVEGALTGMNNSIGKSMLKAMISFSLLKQGLRMVAVTTVEGTNDAIKYESIMDNLGQRLGKSAEQFVKWSETTGRAMGFSKLQSAEMANTLSVTLAQVASSQEDLTNRTTKLMEASALIRSKTGRTMQDVSERIRSAMNQEADGADELGLNVRTSAIQMSDAYKQMADGQAWKDLTTNQQKAILYQYILDETAKNFGTTMAENTSLKVAQFSASLGDLRLALGQAFLPIVNRVLPYLNALVQWLTTAMGYVKVFMETLFGYKHDGGAGISKQAQAVKGYGGAVADATDAQGKLNAVKAKGAKADEDALKAKFKGLSSFDELNTLSKQTTSSSDGGGGGDTGDSGGGGGIGDFGAGGLQLATESTGGLMGKLSEAQQKVAEFAGRFKAFMMPIVEVCKSIWNAIVTYVKGALQGINDWWSENGSYISKGFKNLWDNILYPVLKFLVEIIWNEVKGAIDGLIGFFQGLIQFIGGIFSGEWKKVFESVWMMVEGAFKAIWHIINLIFIVEGVGAIKSGIASIGSFFTGLFSSTGEKSIVTLVGKALRAILDFFKNIMPRCWDELLYAFKSVGTWAKTSLLTPFTNVLSAIGNLFKANPKEWWTAITGVFKGLAGWFKTNLTSPIGKALNGIFVGTADLLVSKLKNVYNNIRLPVNDFISGFNKVSPVNIPFKLPELYNGGITNGKTIAQIGDNVGGQEVVAPLDRLNSIIAKTMADTMSWNGGGGSNGGSTEVVLKVGSTEFGRVCVDSINKLTKQEGRLALNI